MLRCLSFYFSIFFAPDLHSWVCDTVALATEAGARGRGRGGGRGGNSEF